MITVEIILQFSLRGRRKKEVRGGGGGGEKSAKAGKRKVSPVLSLPNSPPFSPPPYPLPLSTPATQAN